MQISSIAPAIITAFGVFAASTALHELSHMLACRVLHCRIIGWKILFVSCKGRRLSLNLKDRNHCAFTTENTRKMRIVMAAGPAADFLASAACFLCARAAGQGWCGYGLLGAACLIFVSAVYNMLPATNGDGKMLFGKDDG